MFAANRFDLLGEDESGDGAVTRPIPVQQAKKEDKPAAKAPAKPVKKEEAKPARKPEGADNKAVKSDRPSGERRPRREERAEEPADTKGFAVTAGNGSPATERPYRPRSDRPFNGERRERRERENAGAPGNRRVFDRRSGTGRGREDKRGGAGRGNWGSLTDEKAVPATEEKPEGVTEEATGEEAAAEQTEAATEPAEQAPPRELSPEELARIAEREKEEKLMTLDEYLKIKKGVDIPLPEQRKAGEGEDSAQWAKFIAAKSDKNEEEEKAGSSGAKPKEKKATKEPKAQAAPALLRFRSEAAQRRDAERRERNQRFRDQQDRPDRPDRPERPPRAPAAAARPAAAKPEFQLEADFPALKA